MNYRCHFGSPQQSEINIKMSQLPTSSEDTKNMPLYLKNLTDLFKLSEILQTGDYSPFEAYQEDELNICSIDIDGWKWTNGLCTLVLDMQGKPLSKYSLHDYTTIIHNGSSVDIKIDYYIVMVENMFLHVPDNPKYCSYRIERYYGSSVECLYKFLQREFVDEGGIYSKLNIAKQISKFIEKGLKDGISFSESMKLSDEYTRLCQVEHLTRDSWEKKIEYMNNQGIVCSDYEEYIDKFLDLWSESQTVPDKWNSSEFGKAYSKYCGDPEFDLYENIEGLYNKFEGDYETMMSCTPDGEGERGITELADGYTTIFKVSRNFKNFRPV